MKETLTNFFTSRGLIRAAVTTALVAYPSGCLALLLLPERFEWIGGACWDSPSSRW